MFNEAAASLNIPLKVVRDSYADGRTKYEARMILIRPDQHIVWCGNRAPDKASFVMHTVAGRGPVM